MESARKKNSEFASAIKSSPEKILEEHEIVSSQKFFTEVFGAITGIGAVINENRQIVYVNENFIKSLEIQNIDSILGKRPGEVISCIHANNNTGGCGTGYACTFCGAVNAIIESQRTGRKASREALVTTHVNGKFRSLDLNIISTPVYLSGKTFYALIFQDISHEKRRAALERIFFHDLLNSVGGLNGMLSLIKNGTSPKIERDLINLSEEASREIIDEIQLHRHLLAAENGELELHIENIESVFIIHDAINRIGFHNSGRNKTIIVDDKIKNIRFETDKIILQRILVNLLKNALEATSQNGRVLIGVEDIGKKIRFWVKNDQLIPAHVQAQLFQRSFSTKGKGRGLGTYSIRLLTENYLKGNVGFVSSEAEGTVFEVVLNKVFS